MTLQDDEKRQATRQRLERRRQQQKELHPTRNHSYEFHFDVRNHRSSYQYMADNTDYIFLEWIRQASNVSCLFRQELGEALWSRVTIMSNCDDSDIWALPAFLDDLPATHTGIKALHMSISLKNMDDFHDEKKSIQSNSKNFEAWCSCIATALKLETLSLSITIQENKLSKISRGKGISAQCSQ